MGHECIHWEADGRDSKTFIGRHYSIDCCRDRALQAHVAGCREFDRQHEFWRMRRLHARPDAASSVAALQPGVLILLSNPNWKGALSCLRGAGGVGPSSQVMRRGPHCADPLLNIGYTFTASWPVAQNLINLMENLRVPLKKFISYKHVLQ